MNADAIVKALKCCNVPSGRACSECPYHEVGVECRTKRNKDAVELILELVDERRRCLEALSELADNIGLLKDKEKTDTVRKMQEKIRAKSEYGTINISPWQLDQIAKEVLDENNGIH